MLMIATTSAPLILDRRNNNDHRDHLHLVIQAAREHKAAKEPRGSRAGIFDTCEMLEKTTCSGWGKPGMLSWLHAGTDSGGMFRVRPNILHIINYLFFHACNH
jgi:hypothetical protein